MTFDEIEAIVKAALEECEQAGYPLNARQESILLTAVQAQLQQRATRIRPVNDPEAAIANPLDELTDDERQALIDFINREFQADRDWKATLLNDWLRGESSGSVQFLRDRYGLSWLEQVQSWHIRQYLPSSDEDVLNVGDRIEVSNDLWEWVKEGTSCDREWFPCTVIAVFNTETAERLSSEISCTVRFSNGIEYDIQGMYSWNRYYWRWPNAGCDPS